MRFSRDEMLMTMAKAAAMRSTCNRLKVGVIIAHESRPVSLGYNGAPSGLPHCDGRCNKDNPCKSTIHAEHNAIKWAMENRKINTLEGCTLYVTHSPCMVCAFMIKGSGIGRVVYDEKYRDTSGIDYLEYHGVEIKQCPVKLAISASSANTLITPASRESVTPPLR